MSNVEGKSNFLPVHTFTRPHFYSFLLEKNHIDREILFLDPKKSFPIGKNRFSPGAIIPAAGKMIPRRL
jgi:hypothetical protein